MMISDQCSHDLPNKVCPNRAFHDAMKFDDGVIRAVAYCLRKPKCNKPDWVK